MSQDLHRASVESTVYSALASSYPGVPVKFENVPFVQPETVWTAVHLIDGPSTVTNLGAGKQIDRYVGIVQLDVLVPELTGTSLSIQIASWAGALFRLKTISLPDGSTVRYRTPAMKSKGAESGFHRCCMTIGYWRDEAAQ